MFAKRESIKIKLADVSILTQPNIPKPLHGLNPRTVLGKDWWDKTRFKAQKDYGYKCSACGIEKEHALEHQWLEGHEAWDINYKTGICEVTSIVPLCHYCHNFIHSGRLAALIVDKNSKEKAIKIINHGINLLCNTDLKVFPGTLVIADELGVCTKGLKSYKVFSNLEWSDYKMKLEGKLYKSLYKNYFEWEDKYVDI